VNSFPAMKGYYVTDAHATITDQNTGKFEVSLNMNAEGAKRWSDLTRENIQKPLAFVY